MEYKKDIFRTDQIEYDEEKVSYIRYFEEFFPVIPPKVPPRSEKEKNEFIERIEKNKGTRIYKRFIDDGILSLLKYDDFIENWRYIGGTAGTSDFKKYIHPIYLKKKHGIVITDSQESKLNRKCICGTDITQRIFITNGNKVITIGNECVQTFFEDNCKFNINTMCILCDKHHRNRIGSLCKECRPYNCWKCGTKVIYNQKFCIECDDESKVNHENRGIKVYTDYNLDIFKNLENDTSTTNDIKIDDTKMYKGDILEFISRRSK